MRHFFTQFHLVNLTDVQIPPFLPLLYAHLIDSGRDHAGVPNAMGVWRKNPLVCSSKLLERTRFLHEPFL